LNTLHKFQPPAASYSFLQDRNPMVPLHSLREEKISELQKNLKIIADNLCHCVKRLFMKIKWAGVTSAQSVGVPGGNE